MQCTYLNIKNPFYLRYAKHLVSVKPSCVSGHSYFWMFCKSKIKTLKKNYGQILMKYSGYFLNGTRKRYFQYLGMES